jgi:hypothetical protein
MSAFGSAVIHCHAPAGAVAFFVVGSADGIFASFPAGDDPVVDLVRARRCASSLADRVFVACSVERYWTDTARLQEAIA